MHDQMRTELDEATQTQTFKDMMKLVTETNVDEVPLVNRTNLAAKSKRIQSYTGSPWASSPNQNLKNGTLGDA